MKRLLCIMNCMDMGGAEKVMADFMKILQPLFEIRQGMELFAGGDRDIRIEPETKDELAGISRVFNKMADDIDMQILNLKNLSDIYYKFMPMSMIRMLKQEKVQRYLATK